MLARIWLCRSVWLSHYKFSQTWMRLFLVCIDGDCMRVIVKAASACASSSRRSLLAGHHRGSILCVKLVSFMDVTCRTEVQVVVMRGTQPQTASAAAAAAAAAAATAAAATTTTTTTTGAAAAATTSVAAEGEAAADRAMYVSDACFRLFSMLLLLLLLLPPPPPPCGCCCPWCYQWSCSIVV